jgi:hypothetical protein
MAKRVCVRVVLVPVGTCACSRTAYMYLESVSRSTKRSHARPPEISHDSGMHTCTAEHDGRRHQPDFGSFLFSKIENRPSAGRFSELGRRA